MRDWQRWLTTSLSYLSIVAFGALLSERVASAEPRVLLTADNPDPARLPTLAVWEEYAKRHDRYDRLLSATFPQIPEFTTDLWCFESPGVEFESAHDLGDGRVQLRHRWSSQSWTIVSTVTPQVGAIDFVSRMVPHDAEDAAQPSAYPSLNICWQLRRAKTFASEPDPYPQFVARCFIFARGQTAEDSGRTFLLDTVRRPIPVKPATHRRNNPPWVQMYLPTSAPVDMRAGPTAWADYSPDRFTVPLIGAVSRDGRFLAAMASGAESMVCQAWHDCMHNNARWLPADDGVGKTWHVKIYAMENDPARLLERFRDDFPAVPTWEAP